MEKLQRKIKKNTFVLFAGKQICIEDKKSCVTKQLTHRVLGGVRGCIPTARASPSPKAVPGSGVHHVCILQAASQSCSSHWRSSRICSVSSSVLSKAHQSSHLHVLTHVWCLRRPRASWQLGLCWRFIWPKKIFSNKIKVYMYPSRRTQRCLKGEGVHL